MWMGVRAVLPNLIMTAFARIADATGCSWLNRNAVSSFEILHFGTDLEQGLSWVHSAYVHPTSGDYTSRLVPKDLA
jgi:hypothetical protein